MARSNQNRKVIPSEGFSDTLDKILNKAVLLVEVTDLSQDDDIMDQLIMEDVFDVADEEIERLSNSVNNQKMENDNKKNVENIISEIRKGQVDEFSASERTKIQKIRPDGNKGGLNVDDLLDLVDEKSNINQDEFTKNDTNPELEDKMVAKHKYQKESVENVDKEIECLSKGVNDLELAIKNKKAMENKTSDERKEEADEFSDSEQSIKKDGVDIDDLLDSVDEESHTKQEVPTEIDEFAEEDETLKLVLEKEVVEKNEVDEFSNLEQTSIEKNNLDELNIKKDGEDVDDLLDSIDEESKVKHEKPTESDEFSENDLKSEPEMEEVIVDNVSVENIDEQNSDSIIADFDISSVEELLEPDNEIDELVEKVQTTDEGKEEIDLLLNQTSEEIKKSNIAIDGLNNKVNQLIEDNDSLRNQISVLVAAGNDDNDMSSSIGALKKQQRSQTKQLKAQLSPILTYAALGLAGFSVLLAGGLGAIGYGAQSDVSELSELVATLDEETDDLIANSSKADIEKLNEKTRLLISKNEKLTVKIDEIKNSIITNSLEPIVDDLVENSDETQQTIDKLLAKVEQLEKRKPVTVKAKPKPRKVNKVVKKSTWVVNLVSFKQEWYAKSKAEEFEKKGVPTDIIKVKVKGENWFRLRVKDFKSKYDAANYAVKVKKTLNLGSVWVTKF